METRRQGLGLWTAVCVLIGVVVVIQLWLVAAALDALLAEDRAVLAPAALASLGLFAVEGGLLAWGWAFDRRLRRSQTKTQAEGQWRRG